MHVLEEPHLRLIQLTWIGLAFGNTGVYFDEILIISALAKQMIAVPSLANGYKLFKSF